MKTSELKKYKDALQILNAIVTINDNKSGGYINWGKKNNFPIICKEMIQQSATATACYNTKSQFLQADGFVDKNLSNIKCNEYQTFDDLLGEICDDFAWIEAFAIVHQKNFNDSNKLGNLYHIPVSWCRIGIDNDYIYVNENFGKKDFKRTETKKYPIFGSEYSVIEQINEYGEHLGEILFAFRKNLISDLMPIPSWFSGERDVLTESELSYYDYETIANGMQVNGFFVLIGQKNQTINEDENGNRIKSDLEETIENVSSFSGRGERNKTMVITVDSPEEMPKWIGQDTKSVFDAATGMRERIAKSIARAWEVPPVLIGIETPGRLGSSQQLEMEINLFNMKLNPYQRFITSILNVLKRKYNLPYDFTISTLNIKKVDETN